MRTSQVEEQATAEPKTGRGKRLAVVLAVLILGVVAGIGVGFGVSALGGIALATRFLAPAAVVATAPPPPPVVLHPALRPAADDGPAPTRTGIGA
ncbi:MAG: hypothetical protein WAK86_09480, partial [Pseudonocardiaceae bacterium]